MAPTKWIADAMLGRLARYVRFVGGDVVYVRTERDAEIVARAVREDRVVLTRDRELARRAPGALWVASPRIAAQWKELRAVWPELPSEPSFVRCSRCNGRLGPYRIGTAPEQETGLPRDRTADGLEVWSCADCGHLYWEGSHTARIRAQLAAWSTIGGP